MKYPEKRLAKKIDMPGRSQEFTDMVYSGVSSIGMWPLRENIQGDFLFLNPEKYYFNQGE